MGTELHTLTPPAGARKKRKRLGRGLGSGLGQTAGKGSKGQKKRSTVRLGFEGGQNPIHRRIPKRGFKPLDRVEVYGVNVSLLDLAFHDGDVVTPEVLHQRGLVPKRAAVMKLLAHGDLGKKLTVKLHRVSETARGKVEAAGGTVELLGGGEASDAG